MVKRAHIIRDNKTLSIPHRLLFFDVETPDEDWRPHLGEQTLKLGVACFTHIEEFPGKIKDTWYYFHTPQEFWSFVDRHIIKGEKLYMFAHNTVFDFRVCKGYEYLRKLNFSITFDTFDSNPFILRAKRNKEYLEILDTANYFKVSVETLGESLGIPKLKMPVGIPDKQKWFEYCQRDVEIIRKAMLHFLDLIKTEELGSFGHTIAKQAYNAYRHRFMKYPITVHNFPDITEYERRSYKGGRTDCFQIGHFNPPLVCYDINSAYPYVMQKYTYPTRYHHKERNISLNRLLELMNEYLVIADLYFEISQPAIGIKRKRLIFPVGKIHETVTSPEIELILHHGQIHSIPIAICYEHAPIFKEYVEYFYNRRLEAKRTGNKTLDLFYKIFLNSLYGKFGQRSEKWEIVEEFTTDPDGVYYYYDIDTNQKYMERIINSVRWRKIGFDEGYDSFPAIASFVTAYQRCYLWKIIKTLPEGAVKYCDTDSFFIDPQYESYLKPLLHPTKLGYLKREDYRIHAIFNVKDYVLDTGKHIKGIRDDAIEISPNTYIQKQFNTAKSAIHEGNADKVTIREIQKKLDRAYRKGNVLPNGKVKPIVLNEW